MADANAVADAKADVAAGGEVTVAAAVPATVAGNVAVELKPVTAVEAALGTKISLAAADLDLKGVATLLVTGQVKLAAELELLLNAPAGASHSVDIDADGKLDYVQVVELPAVSQVTFELRAVPLSKLDASLAVSLGSIVIARAEGGGKLVVSASYGAAVAGGADFEFSQDVAADLHGSAVTVADASTGAFLAWTFVAGRPVYVSTRVSTADIELAANGAVHLGGDTAAHLDAARLAGLRAGLAVKAAIGAPKIEADGKLIGKAGAKAEANAGVKAGAKAVPRSATAPRSSTRRRSRAAGSRSVAASRWEAARRSAGAGAAASRSGSDRCRRWSSGTPPR